MPVSGHSQLLEAERQDVTQEQESLSEGAEEAGPTVLCSSCRAADNEDVTSEQPGCCKSAGDCKDVGRKLFWHLGF